ncbi:hypothetical protein, partial [Nocardia sp. NPDC058497]|uniref:hypothetical protein n=1 Tax=Nocardia sp. NPDC058497 TaxID=3346529 RepID=UPI00365202D7
MTDPAFDSSGSSAALIAVAESIMENKKYQDEWASSTLVTSFAGGTRSIFGYTYFEDGSWTARTPDGFSVMRNITALRKAMSEEGKPDWKSCLVQLKKTDMSIKDDF